MSRADKIKIVGVHAARRRSATLDSLTWTKISELIEKSPSLIITLERNTCVRGVHTCIRSTYNAGIDFKKAAEKWQIYVRYGFKTLFKAV